MLARQKVVSSHARHQTLSAADRAEMARVRKAELAEFKRLQQEEEERKAKEIAEKIRLREEALRAAAAAEAERLRLIEEARLAAEVVVNRQKAIYLFLLKLFHSKVFRKIDIDNIDVDEATSKLVLKFDECHEGRGLGGGEPMMLAIYHFRKALGAIASPDLFDSFELTKSEFSFSYFNALKAYHLVSSVTEKKFVTCMKILAAIYMHGHFYDHHNHFGVVRDDQKIREKVEEAFREFVRSDAVETIIKASYPIKEISKTLKIVGDHGEKHLAMKDVTAVCCTLNAQLGYQLKIPHPEDPEKSLGDIRPTIYQVVGSHDDVVNCIAEFDGRLFTASSDMNIAVWDLSAPTPRRLCTLKGHTDEVYCLRIAAEAAELYSCSADRLVIIWDISGETIRKKAELEGHEDTVYSLALTNPLADVNAHRLFSGSFDQRIFMWDTLGAKRVATLRGHTDCVEAMAVSNDNMRLYSGAGDGTICIWNIAPTLKKPVKIVAIPTAHGSRVRGIALTLDNTRMYSSSLDGATGLVAWDLTAPTLIPAVLWTLTDHTDGVRSFCLTRDETRLITGSLNCPVKAWNLQAGNESPESGGPRQCVPPPLVRVFASGTKGASALFWYQEEEGNVCSRVYVGMQFGNVTEVLSV